MFYDRDDIEDEQYLFEGVKLTEAEYREYRYGISLLFCLSSMIQFFFNVLRGICVSIIWFPSES